jgi:hypothetical protein
MWRNRAVGCSRARRLRANESGTKGGQSLNEFGALGLASFGGQHSPAELRVLWALSRAPMRPHSLSYPPPQRRAGTIAAR